MSETKVRGGNGKVKKGGRGCSYYLVLTLEIIHVYEKSGIKRLPEMMLRRFELFLEQLSRASAAVDEALTLGVQRPKTQIRREIEEEPNHHRINTVSYPLSTPNLKVMLNLHSCEQLRVNSTSFLCFCGIF